MLIYDECGLSKNNLSTIHSEEWVVRKQHTCDWHTLALAYFV